MSCSAFEPRRQTGQSVCLRLSTEKTEKERERGRGRQEDGRKSAVAAPYFGFRLQGTTLVTGSRPGACPWRSLLPSSSSPFITHSMHPDAQRDFVSLSPLLLSHSLSAFLSLPEYAMPGLRGRRTQSHTQRERQTYAITGGLIRSSRAQDEGARDARREAGIWSMSPSRGSPEEEAAAATGVSLSLSFLVSLSLSLFRRRVPATRGDDGCCCCLRRRRSCQRS